MERDLVMKKLLLLFFFAAAAFAQNPDCQINFGPWTDTNATPSNANGITQCTYWVMTYQVTGFTVISLQFESATGTNSGGPGAFGAYSGTVSSGVNPSVSVACATVTNCTATFTGQVGWYRVNFPSHTGSGSIQGVLKGYKVGYPLGGASVPGGGCAGTVATPCIVAGVAADGAAVAGSPVLVAGQDGTNAQTLLTDTTGRPIVVGAAAAAAAKAGNPVLVGGQDGTNAQSLLVDTAGRVQLAGATNNSADGLNNSEAVIAAGSGSSFVKNFNYRFNGATWDRDFACTSTAAITFTAASGTQQIIALAASQVIRVCSILLASDTLTNITLEYGTGALCGTGTTAISGPIPNVLTFAMSWNPETAIRTAASNAFCIVSSAVATIGGTVTYAQF
jgi:hypothetical protein